MYAGSSPVKFGMPRPQVMTRSPTERPRERGLFDAIFGSGEPAPPSVRLPLSTSYKSESPAAKAAARRLGTSQERVPDSTISGDAFKRAAARKAEAIFFKQQER